MHNLACYLPSDNGLIGPCIVFPEWFIIEFNWVAPYNVSSLLENLTKLSSKTESWLVRRVFWIKDWVLFWTGVNGSSSHGINFRPIKNVNHLQYVAPNLRITEKYAFIKKIHNFYAIITKFCENEVLMSTSFTIV